MRASASSVRESSGNSRTRASNSPITGSSSIGLSSESVAQGVEVVLAFFWAEQIADLSDSFPESVDGSDGLGAQMGLELGEGHFDWIEIWTIGGQEQDPCAPGANGLVSGRAFMGRQVVHDDDVARLEG